MTARKRKRAPGGGRKPAGIGGEKTSEYPVQQLRFPISTLAPMRALSAIRGIPLWRLFNEAALEYLIRVDGVEARKMTAIANTEATKLQRRRQA